MVDEEQFLETTSEEAGGFALATGIDWSALGKSMIGSLIATYFIAANAGIEAIVSMYELAFGALGGWLARVVETVFAGPTEFLDTARATSLASIDGILPLLAFPIGVGLALGSVWIVARGVEVLRS